MCNNCFSASNMHILACMRLFNCKVPNNSFLKKQVLRKGRDEDHISTNVLKLGIALISLGKLIHYQFTFKLGVYLNACVNA